MKRKVARLTPINEIVYLQENIARWEDEWEIVYRRVHYDTDNLWFFGPIKERLKKRIWRAKRRIQYLKTHCINNPFDLPAQVRS